MSFSEESSTVLHHSSSSTIIHITPSFFIPKLKRVFSLNPSHRSKVVPTELSFAGSLIFFSWTWLRYVRVGLIAIANPSICLSSVTSERPITQPVEIFGNVSTSFCTLAIRWPSCKILRMEIVPREPLRRKPLTQEGYQNRAILDLSKAISHKRYKTRPRVRIMTNRKSYP